MDISWLAALTRPAKRYITSIGMQLTASPHSLDGKLVRYVCWKAAIAHQRRARGFEQRAHALLYLCVWTCNARRLQDVATASYLKSTNRCAPMTC